MRKVLMALAILSLLIINTGCVPIWMWAAAAGGTGVYAASKDTIQGESDISYESLWDSAMEVSKMRGTIHNQDFDKGSIEMSEGKATKTWIRLEKVTASTSRLKVSSRKYKMPNLELAQQVYTKILDQAKGGEVK